MYLPEFSCVRFYHVCNGVIQYAADSNNNTDESHCSMTEWSCDTYHSKCDRVWNCPDGRDELGCLTVSRSSLYCHNREHFCFRNSTGEPMCLSTLQAGDGIIDCVGSWDEREFCRRKYPFEVNRRYRCQNSSICISILSICDCQQDCPENDDETIACRWFHNGQKCDRRQYWNERCSFNYFDKDYDGRPDFFCDLGDERMTYFWNLEQKQKVASTPKEHRVKRQSEENVDYSVIWSCNRGIYVRSRKDPEGFACFCPDHYYGDRCQYQRKRVFVNLQMEMLTAFNQESSTSIFVVLLVHGNQSNMTIISHTQFIIMPRFRCEDNFAVQLLYPTDEPYRSLTNHSVHIHMFDRQTLRHQKSWNFSLKFEFLPVQRLSKRLYLPELDVNTESKLLPIPYTSCDSCSNNSVCIGPDVSLGRDICICSTNYTGRRCFLPLLDLCTNINCNGHGTCQPVSIYVHSDIETICICDPGWTGEGCNVSVQHINVSLARDVAFLSSNIAFLHLIFNPYYDYETRSHDIYAHRVEKEILDMIFFNDRTQVSPHAAFVQFYEHSSKFDYYLLFYYSYFEEPTGNITAQVQSTHRCRSINELFDTTILAQPDIRRVKYYQQPCLQRHHQRDPLVCFYDADLMCVCREDNYTDCLNMETNLKTCDKKWCNGRGICVQNDDSCLTYSLCICEKCVYGPTCQFSTYGYSLSLDGIIGSHISLSVSKLSQQSPIIRTAVAVISVVIVIGIVLNILSISTFIQKETHEVGCGLYLLVSSIIGFLTTIVLVCKMILLLTGERSHASCSLVEFFLRWCPTSCEWLNACVAFERTIAVKRATKYSRTKSKYFSKWATTIILILVACMCIPEFFFREIMIDPFDNRAWCVLTLNREKPGLLAMYSILNIFSFLIPLLVNLSSGVIIILAKLESKQKANQKSKMNTKKNLAWRRQFQLIRTQILKHKHILIGPALLGLLSLPRLILTFIFVCTKLDQNSIPSLLAYLVGFLPSMAIIFAFVCPSQTYRAALVKSLKTIVPRCVRN